MNTYGDWGNVCVLQKRLEWRGCQVDVIKHHPGSRLSRRPDIIFFGGGQDSGQSLILDDLHKQAPRLREWIEDGVATLAICGGYQLLGREFITATGENLEGVGVFNITTQAQPGRLIGNVVLTSDRFGSIVGFENHSGRTFLDGDTEPFGVVDKGSGNNGEEKTLSGIIIPASGDKNESTKRGKVVAIGEGKIEDGKKIPVSVSVGDVVIYQWGDKMKIGGEEFTLVKDSEIIAKAK
jgi:CobQ-like glutamine amidotransferase family enzyme